MAKVCPERWAQVVTDFLCDLDESKTQAPQNINAFTIISPMNNGNGSVIRTWSPIPREKRQKRAPGRNNARATTRSTYPDSRFMANIVAQSASVRRPGDAPSRSHCGKCCLPGAEPALRSLANVLQANPVSGTVSAARRIIT